mmetsp:Transcript_26832/g.58701  ORF Transcript_26832/g.58701 Transcript_26832/m.58701 type:complete len:200 (+) Transcript_26832:456-1055(+)
MVPAVPLFCLPTMPPTMLMLRTVVFLVVAMAGFQQAVQVAVAEGAEGVARRWQHQQQPQPPRQDRSIPTSHHQRASYVSTPHQITSWYPADICASVGSAPLALGGVGRCVPWDGAWLAILSRLMLLMPGPLLPPMPPLLPPMLWPWPRDKSPSSVRNHPATVQASLTSEWGAPTSVLARALYCTRSEMNIYIMYKKQTI